MEEFIRNVTEQIRCVRAREGIAKELSDHIEDQAAAYEEAGQPYDEAVKRAVMEMGDPVEVGVELDRIHRPQMDYKMMGMAFAFSIAGLFVIYMIDDLAAYPEYFIRQCGVLLLSFAVMAGMNFLDYSFIGRYAYGICGFVTAAIFVSRMYAARDGVIPITFTLVYLYVPIYAGLLYRLRRRGYSAVVWGIGMQIAVMLLTYELSGTLYTALNVYMMCTALLVMAVCKRWFAVDRKVAVGIVVGMPLLLMVGVLLFWFMHLGNGHGFRSERLMGWLDPQAYADGSGYIYLVIRRELEAAKWVGASENTLFTSDFIEGPMNYPTIPLILVQIVCTYGKLAGLALTGTFAAVIIRAFHIVKNQKNQLGFMLSASCFMIFLVNCLEGVLINTGYHPINSMQLPFVSYGACTGITYAVLIGLLLSIHRNEKILTNEAAVSRPVWRLSIKWEKR